MSRLERGCNRDDTGACSMHDAHCWGCGSAHHNMDELCDYCQHRWCKRCNRLQKSHYNLHTERDDLDEPLPCGWCDDCCKCFNEADEPQTLGDA